jgi:hypothetical protein
MAGLKSFAGRAKSTACNIGFFIKKTSTQNGVLRRSFGYYKLPLKFTLNNKKLNANEKVSPVDFSSSWLVDGI